MAIRTLTLDIGGARLNRVLKVHDRPDRRLLRLEEPIRRFVRVLVSVPGPRRLKSHLMTLNAPLHSFLHFGPYLFGRRALLQMISD